MRVGVIGIALVALALAAFRIEGVNGNIVPQVRFRWQPHADQELGKLPRMTPAPKRSTWSRPRPTTIRSSWARGGSRRSKASTWRAIGRPARQNSSGGSRSARLGRAFAVVGPYAVTQEQRGNEELITCYEIDTGKLRWAHATPVRFDETLAGVGPRATPTIHEGKVYAMGARVT